MSVLSAIGNLATGGILGSITGLAGSGLQLWGASKKNKHDLKVKEIELKRLALEADEERKMVALENEFKDRVNIRDNEQKIIATDVDLLKTAINSDKATYSSGVSSALERMGENNMFASVVGVLSLGMLALVDSVRGLLRPIACAYILYQVSKLSGEMATETVTYLATMMVSFYFGSRALGKGMKQ